MANSNRVFVSPGVYTSEKDLTFVAQSVGVTTLGLVGETLKGPAFEPILITDFDEFKTYFGGTSPEKDGNLNPKYELPYVAKSYLQESNQLFVTRVLGKTGYKPEKTFGIKTIGGITLGSYSGVTTGLSMSGNTLANLTGSTLYSELSGKTSIDGDSITDYIFKTFSGFTSANHNNWFIMGALPTGQSEPTGTELVSPLTGKQYADNVNGKEWYNSLVSSNNNEVYSYKFIYNSGTTKFDVTKYTFNSSLNANYNDVVVAALRPRGYYSGNTLLHEVTTNGYFSVTEDVDNIEINPMGEFVINVTGSTGGAKSYTCSLNTTSTKYITKVLGIDVFDKNRGDFPLYVHEVYPKFLKESFARGLVRGLSLTEVYESDGDNFIKSWDTTLSPTVVSEVRGGRVSDLFDVITISDGEAANFQVKLMIQKGHAIKGGKVLILGITSRSKIEDM